MSSLLTNESSLIALTTLRSINKNLNMVQQQISTGKSVSNARDNASIWAVATVMQSDVDSFSAISDSLNLGASTVAVARGASEQVTSLLQEMKNLVVAAQEDNVDRAKIQTDVTQLTEQIDSIVGAAQFNGLNLLSGTAQLISWRPLTAPLTAPSRLQKSRSTETIFPSPAAQQSQPPAQSPQLMQFSSVRQLSR